jgi:hypothetical protein
MLAQSADWGQAGSPNRSDRGRFQLTEATIASTKTVITRTALLEGHHGFEVSFESVERLVVEG